LHALTSYLAVSDALAALDFYVEVFGAVRRGDPIVMSDGKIGHAELGIGDSVLIAEEHPEIGHVAATSGGASIWVEVSAGWSHRLLRAAPKRRRSGMAKPDTSRSKCPPPKLVVPGVGRFGLRLVHQPEPAFLTFPPAPVVGEFVPRHADQPRDSDRCGL
jgi:hypothetical protein